LEGKADEVIIRSPAYIECDEKLDTATAREKVEDQHDHCQYEQDVDKSAANVKAESEQPQDEENYDDRPKHLISPRNKAVRVVPLPSFSRRFFVIGCRVE
jgi:hypothetical protein